MSTPDKKGPPRRKRLKLKKQAVKDLTPKGKGKNVRGGTGAPYNPDDTWCCSVASCI